MTFRFQSILDLRINERDSAAMDLAKVNEAIAKIESDIAQVDQNIAAMIADTSGRTGNISVDRLLTRGRYEMQLAADRNVLLGTLEKLSNEMAARQQRLAAAQTEVKKFELLSQKYVDAVRQKRNLQEQIVCDEAAGRMSHPTKHH